MDINETKIERGSGAVFKDIGHPDLDTRLLRAEIVTRIHEISRRRRLKQLEAAKLLGIPLPAVARLVQGTFREFPFEPILRPLTGLRRDVQTVTRYSRSLQLGTIGIPSAPGTD